MGSKMKSKEARKQADLADPLERFAGPWALLNADADELREAVHGHPGAEVQDLVDLLEALREVYRLRAQDGRAALREKVASLHREILQAKISDLLQGDYERMIQIVAQYLKEVEEWAKRLTAAYTAAMAIGVKYGLITVALDGTVVEAAEWADRDFETLTGWVAAQLVQAKRQRKSRLFDALRDPLRELLVGIIRATPSNTYVCEWCGRIGPAKRRSRRFCTADCRAAAHYAARRTNSD